ncbi:PaaI family thioesterase [Ramlibacter sp. MAHUQ-53]|uniref:PaaI family thioesterase n=1 Tax=unclassified Ramlibacter TaxID=2617605 RepID=UPI00362BC981
MQNPRFESLDPAFEPRVRASFSRQTAMATLGARLQRVDAGQVEIELPFAAHITQQHGFVHGGVISAVLDSACGYAASSLMPADAGVLTIEFKVNLLAPAKGRRFRVAGEVVKPGRTITVTEGKAWAVDDDGREKLVATMVATMMVITGRDGIQH